MEEDAGPQVVDIAAFQSGGMSEGKKTVTTPDQMDRDWELGTGCFAGANDELVVATSKHRDLNVWSVPNSRVNTSALDTLMRLPSGTAQGSFSAIGYSKQHSTLISCTFIGEIKVWSPFKLPQHSN